MNVRLVTEVTLFSGHSLMQQCRPGHECPYSPDLISPAHAGRHRR